MGKSHKIYYISLISVLILGAFLIYLFSENSLYQLLTAIVIALSYMCLGILHHALDHDLVGKIVVEYILIAVIGIAAAFFIFRGGFGF